MFSSAGISHCNFGLISLMMLRSTDGQSCPLDTWTLGEAQVKLNIPGNRIGQ
jgi:hypothetical protein